MNVNCAGLCVCGEFDWQTLDQIRDQVDTNLRRYLAKTNTTVCREKIKQGPANIVNLIIFRQVEIFHDHRYMAAVRSIRVKTLMYFDKTLLVSIRADDIPH